MEISFARVRSRLAAGGSRKNSRFLLAFFRKRLDDYLSILEKHLKSRRFVVGEGPTVADISVIGYLIFPTEETGYEFTQSHPAIAAWLGRVAALPGWKPPYELLPGSAAPPLSKHVRVGSGWAVIN